MLDNHHDLDTGCISHLYMPNRVFTVGHHVLHERHPCGHRGFLHLPQQLHLVGLHLLHHHQLDQQRHAQLHLPLGLFPVGHQLLASDLSGRYADIHLSIRWHLDWNLLHIYDKYGCNTGFRLPL